MFFRGVFLCFGCAAFCGQSTCDEQTLFKQIKKNTSRSFAYFEGGSEFRIVRSLWRYVAEQCNRM